MLLKRMREEQSDAVNRGKKTGRLSESARNSGGVYRYFDCLVRGLVFPKMTKRSRACFLSD